MNQGTLIILVFIICFAISLYSLSFIKVKKTSTNQQEIQQVALMVIVALCLSYLLTRVFLLLTFQII